MSHSSRSRIWSGLPILLLGLFSRPMLAQQTDSLNITADSMQEMMGAQMEMMTPMWAKMAEASITSTFAALSKPEAAERLAAFTRNYYNALLKKGFTKDEALRIVTSTGIPTFRGGQ
jgi:hypothetical protein